jgi:hypothetical protein
MTAVELLQTLESAGLTLEADGPRLLVGPRDRITPVLADAIRQHKPTLLAIAQAITPGQPLPAPLPGLRGDDWLEAESLIKHALGCPIGARWDAELIHDPTRRGALLDYLAAARLAATDPASPMAERQGAA